MSWGLLILLGVALLLIVLIGAAVVAGVLVRPPRRTVGVAVAQDLPTDPLEAGARSYRTHLIATGGGQIELWDVPGDAHDGPIIIMLHGWGDSRLGELLWLDVLVPVASRLILFDLPGHGESASGACSWGVRETGHVADVITSVTGHPGSESRPDIILFGYSMGAAIAIEAAAQLGRRIAGVIADSPYRSIDQAVRGTMRIQRLPTWPMVPLAMAWLRWRGCVPRMGDVARAARRLTVPLLVLHGAGDRVTPLGDARHIAASAATGTLHEFADCDHLQAGCAHPQMYRQRVADFVLHCRSAIRKSENKESPAAHSTGSTEPLAADER